MVIEKKLKRATFIWTDEIQDGLIVESLGHRVSLGKVYSFALLRFIIRIAQRNWFRKNVKKESTK